MCDMWTNNNVRSWINKELQHLSLNKLRQSRNKKLNYNLKPNHNCQCVFCLQNFALTLHIKNLKCKKKLEAEIQKQLSAKCKCAKSAQKNLKCKCKFEVHFKVFFGSAKCVQPTCKCKCKTNLKKNMEFHWISKMC